MANQQELSDFIKKVHIDLRLSSRKFGAESAWKIHCKNVDILKKYADAMHDLATKYWEKNIKDEQNVNRIIWVVKECDKYFSSKGQKVILEKELRLAQRYFGKVSSSYECIVNRENGNLKLLDVGSCYNPFKSFKQFDVTAIDLAPAEEDVLRCDFLDVKLDNKFSVSEGVVVSLTRQYFDVVVLSLVLEYLPHPAFRYSCCLKAYEVLRPGGALLIITPDSKHPSANSQLIKNWRMALADIGFLKTSYEKTEHLHCMSYTKCVDPRIPRYWLSIKHKLEIDPKDMMLIPQDNVQYKTEKNENGYVLEKHYQRCESDNKQIAENFSVLAGGIYFE